MRGKFTNLIQTAAKAASSSVLTPAQAARSFSSSHMAAHATNAWEKVVRVGFDWDETLVDGAGTTDKVTQAVLAKHGVAASSAAHHVRENIKIAWGNKTTPQFTVPNPELITPLSLEARARRFDPLYRAFQQAKLPSDRAQELAHSITVSGDYRQVPEELKPLVDSYTRHAATLPLIKAPVPLHPDYAQGLSAEDIQMLLIPAFNGFQDAGVDPKKAGILSRAFTEKYKEDYLAHSQLLPGARDTLHMLYNEGFGVAIISNKKEAELHAEVEKHGLNVYTGGNGLAVRGSVPGRDVKPGREIVELAVGDPSTSWLVGDRPSDIRTAQNAECAGSTLFGTGVSAEQIKELKPNMVARDHKELQQQFKGLIAAKAAQVFVTNTEKGIYR